MTFPKAIESHVLSGIIKVNNRKGKKILNHVDMAHDKATIEIYSKNIPKNRRLERLQISERLKKKLDKKCDQT